jgi:amino acid adenylation domain-containing protein
MSAETAARTEAPAGHILDLLRLTGRTGPAVTDPEGTLSYPELDERAAAIAAALRERGVRPGEPVLVHCRASRWAVAAMLGVLRAGARYVPVDVNFPQLRQTHMARISGARLRVVEPSAAAPPWPDAAAEIETIPADVGAVAAVAGAAAEIRGPLAYSCFTSGSTGAPAMATISSAALAYSTAARLKVYPDPVGCFVLCSSISFDSSVAGIYWTLASGGHLVIPSDRPSDLLAVAKAVNDHGASHILMLPSLYDVLIAGQWAKQLGCLDVVVVAGETCTPELVGRHFAALPETRMYNEYGPTECTVWATVHECAPRDAELAAVPIGRAIPGTGFQVRGADGSVLRRGELGELHLSGPGLAEQYRAAGVYPTGDVVLLAEDGELHFRGRVDDQLKLGGVRVSRTEVEKALQRHDAVSAAGVGLGGARGRTRLVGFVVLRDGAAIEVRALRQHVLGELPAVAVPTKVVTVSALPSLPNGKLDHRALDRLATEALAPRATAGAAESAVPRPADDGDPR